MLSLVAVSGLRAQTMEFKETEHSFGTIPELGGAVSHRFEYTNTGDKPLVLSTVHTSCGCTSPSWSKEPIMPQKTGYIDVTFDPRDRVGSFMKSVIVNSNDPSGTTILYIKGEVEPRPEPVSAQYPYKMFDLRLKATTVNFNKVLFGSKPSHDIEVYNPTQANIKIEPDVANMPDYMSITPKPSVLGPGDKGIIRCELNTLKYNKFDYIQFSLPILVNTYSYNLHFKAFITETFSDKDRKMAPAITLASSKDIDLGDFDEGDVAVHTLKFSNTGKSALKIRAIRNACEWLTYKIVTPEVAPGGEGEIQFFIDTDNHPGSQNRYVTLVTNCPDAQNVVVKMKLNVIKRK